MAARLLSLSLLLVLSTCRALAAGTVDSSEGPHTEGRAPERIRDESAAIEAVKRGELREARAILASMIVAENIAASERLVDEGRAIDALLLLDEALALQPRDAMLLFRRGRAAFEAAPMSSQPGFMYEDALGHFRAALRAGYGIEAVFEASRAARRVPDPGQALELARSGAEQLALVEPRPAIVPPIERTWAEAAFDVYLEELGAESEAAAEYFVETEDMLERLLGRTPDDPWPREQLANLYLWDEQVDAAIAQIHQAIDVAPEEQRLHDRLMDLVPTAQGYPALVEYYESFAVTNPGPRAQRNLGVASFYAALARFDEGDYDAEAFQAAEARFRAARQADKAWETDCFGYEVVARNAIGWCRYHGEEFSAARKAFLSMEDLFAGGLEWSLPGRLPDGVVGLSFVVQKLMPEDPFSLSGLDGMVEAAAIADFLHTYRPEDGNLANNAGFVNRDTGVLFERKWRASRAEAAKIEDADAREAAEAEAGRIMTRAQEIMERSYGAYQIAADLLPSDVRVINDAGLVMVYFLRDDPEAAERYFLRAAELGAEQLEVMSPEDERYYDLNEAWGDAHQNMGILELTIRKRPAEAKIWLEKSLAIGPASRESLRPLLDLCDRMAAGEEIDLASTMIGPMVWLQNPKK